MGRSYQIMKDSALRETGARWRKAIMTFEVLRVVAPYAAVGALLGAVGWVLHRAWVAVTRHPAHPGHLSMPVHAAHTVGAMPGWLWIGMGAVTLVLLWLFRPGRLITPSGRRMRAVQTVTVVFLFAGMIGVGLSQMTG
jgi:hypothetical protein